MEGAAAAPCFLERLSEAMLQWGWRLAAEIENSHLMYIYCVYNTSSLQPDDKSSPPGISPPYRHPDHANDARQRKSMPKI